MAIANHIVQQTASQNAVLTQSNLADLGLCVSVIIPAHNAGMFLPDCLQSTFSQSWRNLQVIVIDDGSSDETESVCQQFMQREPRLEIYRHVKSMGVAQARNLGLEKARGEYLIFLDADDRLAPQTIEKLLNAAIQYQSEFVIAGHYRCKNTMKQVHLEFATMRQFSHETLFSYVKQYLEKPYAYVMLVHCWGRMFRREIIKQHGISFPNQLSQFEDVHFNFQYLQHVDGLIYLPEPLYYYEMHSLQSLSQKMGMDPAFLARSRIAFSQIPLYLKNKQGMVSEKAQKMVEQALTNMWLVSVLRLCRRFKSRPELAVYKQVSQIVSAPDFQINLSQYHPQTGEGVILYWACRTRLTPLVLIAGLFRLGFIRLMARGKV